jgi:dynein assembly factor 5
MQNITSKSLDLQATRLNLTKEQLFSTFLKQTVEILSQNYSFWNQYSPEPRLLQTMLHNSGDAFLGNFDQILPILAENVQHEKDFDLRELILNLVLKSILNLKPESTGLLIPFLFPFVQTVVLKACIWRAGKKAIILRSIAVRLFHAVLVQLKSDNNMLQVIDKLFETDILPICLSNLDDDEMITRKYCLYILDVLLQVPIWKGKF